MTTTEITHATPAGFAASVSSRDLGETIAEQYLASRVDVLLGGGSDKFDSAKRKDKRDLFADFTKEGYAILRNADELKGAALGKRWLGVFSPSHIPYVIDHQNDAEHHRKVPMLAAMTRGALERLANADRFFLLVEGGRGDQACHNCDIAARCASKSPLTKRLDKHDWQVEGPGRFQTELPPGQVAALVAMNTRTLVRVELSDTVREARLDWQVPAGTWKLMAFVCVKDGDPICDYLDPEAADRFIELTHPAYYDRFRAHFGTTIDSTFFDEPTLYRAGGRTWTEKFNEKFRARCGFDPRPYYPALWHDIGPDTQARGITCSPSGPSCTRPLSQNASRTGAPPTASRPPAIRTRKK